MNLQGLPLLPINRPWREYPIGTKAFALGGGHWVKVPDGWRWFNGDTFPTPGGDAFAVLLPHAHE